MNNILTGLVSGSFKEFDMPLIKGLLYFMGAMDSFMSIALLFVNALGIICILWNAFKLRFVAAGVRKACLDIIIKFTLFMFLMNAYPRIVNGVLEVSMNIGLYAGGGIHRLAGSFIKLRNDCETKVTIAQQKVQDFMRNSGHTVIDESTLRRITKSSFLSEDEMEQLFEGSGLDVMRKSEYKNLMGQTMLSRIKSTFFHNEEQARYIRQISDFYHDVEGQNTLGMAVDKDAQQAMITLKALREVLIENFSEDSAGKSKGPIQI